MALSLDDKLLGEKVHYYCSSSEDEGSNDEDKEEAGDETSAAEPGPSVQPPKLKSYSGTCTNTGPKGVVKDWREFKRLETEKSEESERERLALAKKLSLTCRSYKQIMEMRRSKLHDEQEKKKDEQFLEVLSELDDEFLADYRLRRIEEMRKTLENMLCTTELICLTTEEDSGHESLAIVDNHGDWVSANVYGAAHHLLVENTVQPFDQFFRGPKFGKIIKLTRDNFIQEIDKEKPQVTVIVHIYEESSEPCKAMNGCLMCLASEYPTVKFCKISATDARMSLNFVENGVPALLVYKNGELIGNFLQLSREFGDDFYATDVESFLDEYGFLPSKLSVPVIRDKTTGEVRSVLPHEEESSESDFDVD